MIADTNEPVVSRDGLERGEAGLAEALMQVLLHGIYAVRAVLRRADAGDLTMPQFRLLVALEARAGASLNEAADAMGLSAPAASRLVDGLVGRGLVARAELPTDRRRVSLSLTPPGSEVLEAAIAAVLAHLSRQLLPLGADQRVIVSHALSLLHPLLAPAERAARA